jgi:hypothetical protein
LISIFVASGAALVLGLTTRFLGVDGAREDGVDSFLFLQVQNISFNALESV